MSHRDFWYSVAAAMVMAARQIFLIPGQNRCVMILHGLVLFVGGLLFILAKDENISLYGAALTLADREGFAKFHGKTLIGGERANIGFALAIAPGFQEFEGSAIQILDGKNEPSTWQQDVVDGGENGA